MSSQSTLPLLNTFATILGLALTLSITASTSGSMSSSSTQEKQKLGHDDVPKELAIEKEEQKLTASEEELTIPDGWPEPALIIVMGPASCGKSTVGSSLAKALSIPFIDGDSLHPASNVAKMSAGNPLTDEDRLPWLALIRSTAERTCRETFLKSIQSKDVAGSEDWRTGLGRPAVVIACSALKKWYRDILRGEVEAEPPTKDDLAPNPHPDAATEDTHKPATSKLQTYFVYCQGSKELLWERISSRKGHWMKENMLVSQLATLEDPTGEEGVVVVDISKTPDEITAVAVEGISKIASV